MAKTRIASFLTGSENQSESRVTEFPTARRVREAQAQQIEPQVPLEELVQTMRQAIVGDHDRVNEARFAEMIDIMAEQKEDAEARIREVSVNANSLLERVAHLNDGQAELGSRLNAISVDMDSRAQALEQVLDEALANLRTEMDKKIEVLESALRGAVAESEGGTRHTLGELSNMFEHHLNDEDERWERERHHSVATLEQRIAQWRAEIDDSRRQDIADVAHSMVDIGNRLMALRRD